MSDVDVALRGAPAPRVAQPGLLHRVRTWEGSGLLAVLVLLFAVLSFIAPNFLTASNLLNVLQQAAFFGIVAFAMTLVIVSGEIDISVGSQAALSSALLGVLVVNRGLPMWLACLVVLALAAAVGGLAGWIRTAFNVPTFIATLVLYLSLRGVAQLITGTFPIPVDSAEFFYWGSGRILGAVPVSAVYLLVAFAAIALVARKTVFGRSVYAVGGNAKSAQLSGIDVKKVRIAVMAISSIAGAIIGGTALSGGRGTVTGTLVGVLFIALLLNGMVLLGVNPYAQQVVRGAVVLIAVLVNVWRTRRSASE
jgi:ribose/xylose/arabinose/galactoside ABC-type transport system permease subunit